MRATVALASIVAATAAAHASGNYPDVTGEETPQQSRWHFKPTQRAVTRYDAERETNEYMRWRYKFVTALDRRLGTSRDVAAVQREIQSNAATLRWISPRVVLVSANGFLYVVEKHGSRWKVIHRYTSSPTQLQRWNSNQATQQFLLEQRLNALRCGFCSWEKQHPASDVSTRRICLSRSHAAR
jgi:hypothetical protein